MKVARNIHYIPSVISEEDCDTLVNSIEDRWWDMSPEPVDTQPVWQTKCMGRHQCPEVLYQFSRTLAVTYLVDKICELTGFKRDKLMGSEFWPFMRKYQTEDKGRSSFGFHTDPTYYSAVFLLTDSSEFDGGDFLIKRSFFRRAKPIKMKKGDCVVFKGSKRHGVKKITRGVRHSLNFFFWKTDDSVKVYLNE